MQEKSSPDLWEKLWDRNLLTKQIVDQIISVNPAMLNKPGSAMKKTLLMLVLERVSYIEIILAYKLTRRTDCG